MSGYQADSRRIPRCWPELWLAAISRKMNVVYLGVSTSQLFLPLLAALLVMVALLWMNHRIPPVVQRPVVLPLAGVLCPADSVLRSPAAIAVRMPARAPPTSHSPSIPLRLDSPNPGPFLDGTHVAHLLT